MKMTQHEEMELLQTSLDLLPKISVWIKSKQEQLIAGGPSPLPPPHTTTIQESVEITSLKDKLADQVKANGFLNNQIAEMFNILRSIQNVSGQPVSDAIDAPRQTIDTLPQWIEGIMKERAELRNRFK